MVPPEDMQAADFDYFLPPHLIAQVPTTQRDGSRLLVVERSIGRLHFSPFSSLTQWIRPGDLLIFNDSRVIAARLNAIKGQSGAEIELLLLEEVTPTEWWSMVRPGKRVRPGMTLRLRNRKGLPSLITANVLTKRLDGTIRLQFSGTDNLRADLPSLGELPIPPYIQPSERDVPCDDDQRYQTVYARTDGSIAAPTAGLHFTTQFLEDLKALGAKLEFVTLHVGHGTFAPVKSERVKDHVMHEEWYEIPDKTAAAYAQAKSEGRRVIAIGTTSTRVLETAFRNGMGRIHAGMGRTQIFIHPPQVIGSIDGLLTNFHLPQSTLLMLVSAFAAPGRHPEGRDLVLHSYTEAIREGYRFFSYGDAMLLV